MTLLFTGLWNPLRASARRRSLAMAAATMSASGVAMAAVVSMHPPSGGGDLRIPVMLYGDGDETVSGVQFRLNFDPTQFELVEISAGNSATDAGKQVVFSETIPGQGRVLVTGFNNTSMADGQIATLTLRPLTPSAAQYDIALEQALATDPDGNNVAIEYADLFQYPPAAPEPEEPNTPDHSNDGGNDSGSDPDSGESPSPTPSSGPGVDTSGTGGGTGGGFLGMLPGGYYDMPDPQTGGTAAPRARASASTALNGSGATPENGRYNGSGYRSGDRYTAQPERGLQASKSNAQSTPPQAQGHARAANDISGAPVVHQEANSGVNPPPPRSARPTDSPLALAQSASGIIDTAGSSVDSAYALVFDTTEGLPKEGRGVTVIALTTGLPLSLLGLYHWLFGRRSVRPRRNVR